MYLAVGRGLGAVRGPGFRGPGPVVRIAVPRVVMLRRGGRYGLGTLINIGPGQEVDVTPEQAAAYWATGAPPPGVTLVPEVPYGQAPIAPLPVSGAAPGGSAPDYSPFAPAPWPPQNTDDIRRLGIPCLPPDWPGGGSGYYNSGGSPVPAECTALTADQLSRTTGEPLSAYGVGPCSPGSQQLCPTGQANGMPLPAVIAGGPGGGILFQPGGNIVGSAPMASGGSGPGGIQTPADIRATPPSVVPMQPGPGGVYVAAPQAPAGASQADFLATIKSIFDAASAKQQQAQAVGLQAGGLMDFLNQKFDVFGYQIPYWAAGGVTVGGLWLMGRSK